MNKNIPKMWGKGHFRINEFDTIAYVLSDGTPLLSKNRMFLAIGMKRKGSSRSLSPGFKRRDKPSWCGNDR